MPALSPAHIQEHPMFFITYLRRELRRRTHQAILIAMGLALGIGLVVTVSAASAGVSQAESGVLSALYGVGTNVTVTGPAVPAGRFGQTTIQPGRNGVGVEACQNGRCENAAGQTIQALAPQYSPVTYADVADVARLHEVSAAAGGLLLTDTTPTFPQDYGQVGDSAPPSSSFFSVDGVDTGHLALGPLSSGTIISGHPFTAADSGSDVTEVDSGYATSHNLKTGSVITIGGVTFTVIGIVRQPQSGNPTDVYIPLGRAQALKLADGSADTAEVDMIYVTAASAADIPAVQHEIARVLPAETVTTAASLASEVTRSVAGVAKLASDLGGWLAILVLIAAFAAASLLTMSAVARRAREFGTLKAIGWQTRRIVAQVLGETVVMGVAGAAAGVGLGFTGVAIIAAVAPKVSATVPGSSVAFSQAAGTGGGVPTQNPATASHVVAVPVHPSVTVGVIVLAVILAVAGGLLAGFLGSWRIASLRPSDTLGRVA
jgi:putative ABC transport system permease protein